MNRLTRIGTQTSQDCFAQKKILLYLGELLYLLFRTLQINRLVIFSNLILQFNTYIFKRNQRYKYNWFYYFQVGLTSEKHIAMYLYQFFESLLLALWVHSKTRLSENISKIIRTHYSVICRTLYRKACFLVGRIYSHYTTLSKNWLLWDWLVLSKFRLFNLWIKTRIRCLAPV